MSPWATFALLVACAACGDDRECTAAGCLDGVTISMSEPPGALTSREPFPDGAYEIELALDGTTVTCHRTIPQELPLDCTSAPVIVHSVSPTSSAGTVAFDVEVRQTPGVVSAIVRHQGSVLGQGSFTPEYRKVAPNGEACGPVCNFAQREMLSMSFPAP
jgi:hypothetical protein